MISLNVKNLVKIFEPDRAERISEGLYKVFLLIALIVIGYGKRNDGLPSYEYLSVFKLRLFNVLFF